ncbi:hypothetical protein [Streptomyces sp. SPB162]|uniref:hypothetical protein n=1 Tax=Streptomyces sp. SPB162 TaxID=2940560 RepID=UPI002405CCC1|nr:hypothetical protein [Streptomyces sp. SPB162]MDF9813795.1 hypothetical protein [Streptomyces sp. SPB162]
MTTLNWRPRNLIRRDPADQAVAPGGRRWVGLLAEAGVAMAAAALLLLYSKTIHVNPMKRPGQVSGLAAMLLPFMVIAIAIVVAVLLIQRFCRPVTYTWAVRLACAATAGLFTGLIAGGVAVALHGTPWPINGVISDSSVIQKYAHSVATGHGIPDDSGYPPLYIWLLAAWAKLFYDGNTGYALQTLSLVTVAVIGPLAYLMWRTLLSPVWALIIGVVPTLPLIDPYKPYGNLSLFIFIPALALLLSALRRSPVTEPRRLIKVGAGLGLLIGADFLLYSGWFVWSAAGMVVLTLAYFPWKSGPKRALILLGSTAVVFLAVAGWTLAKLLLMSTDNVDRYMYVDTDTDPGYFSIWLWVQNGKPDQWPPLGELGGVGLFAILLAIGLGTALILGARRSVVVVAATCMASAWVMRLWYASHMYRDHAVQLWPRTSWQIMYCLLVLCGFAIYLGVQRLKRIQLRIQLPRLTTAGSPAAGATAGGGGLRARLPLHAGVLACLLLLFGMSGSAIANKYMPGRELFPAYRVMLAHTTPKLDGKCPAYTNPKACVPRKHPWLDHLKK